MLIRLAGTEPGSKPTPRAITERLVRMRAQVRASGTGNFSIGSGKASATSTPRKPRAPSNKSAGNTPASAKRKRSDIDDSAANSKGDAGDDDMKIDTPSKKEKPKRGHVKKESNDSEITLPDLGAVPATPTKRIRTPATCPAGMVVYLSEGENKSIESSSSEYVPEGSVGQENEYIKAVDDEMGEQDWV